MTNFRVEVNRGGEWKEVKIFELKNGELFRMSDPETDEPYMGEEGLTEWTVFGEPYLNEDGIWTVNVC